MFDSDKLGCWDWVEEVLANPKNEGQRVLIPHINRTANHAPAVPTGFIQAFKVVNRSMEYNCSRAASEGNQVGICRLN